MTPTERRASLWLASIYGLRMFGLFLILPVFAIYGRALTGGQEPYLIGLAISIYGLTQAVFQIPLGAASDRFGRKPVIVGGLLLFAAGSAIAALASSIVGVIIGRALQGAGAVSAAVSAFVADSTRESVRTRAMAIVGATIGLTFAAALVVAPPLAAAVGLSGLFWITALLALLGCAVVIWAVPPAPLHGEEPAAIRHGDVLFHPQLLRLNVGVFVLHLCQTALFVVVPTLLIERGGLAAPEHWLVYLPVILVSFAIMVPPMIAAERRGRLRELFLAAIALLTLALLAAPQLSALAFKGLIAFLLAFFVAFNLLEAMQPSLVSRIAPAHLKGFALGVYNTNMSLGLFAGGIVGGTLAKRFGSEAVFYGCAALAALWFVAAWSMKPPPAKH
ncbi:MAG: MFS transporter [Casimicrobiaceae bacterium]|nr:MFS transporter [Casimicrobiaceae bacterium]MDW8311336.1 MFS transporter [Burkholderiales bacterium]